MNLNISSIWEDFDNVIKSCKTPEELVDKVMSRGIDDVEIQDLDAIADNDIAKSFSLEKLRKAKKKGVCLRDVVAGLYLRGVLFGIYLTDYLEKPR